MYNSVQPLLNTALNCRFHERSPLALILNTVLNRSVHERPPATHILNTVLNCSVHERPPVTHILNTVLNRSVHERPPVTHILNTALNCSVHERPPLAIILNHISHPHCRTFRFSGRNFCKYFLSDFSFVSYHINAQKVKWTSLQSVQQTRKVQSSRSARCNYKHWCLLCIVSVELQKTRC